LIPRPEFPALRLTFFHGLTKSPEKHLLSRMPLPFSRKKSSLSLMKAGINRLVDTIDAMKESMAQPEEYEIVWEEVEYDVDETQDGEGSPDDAASLPDKELKERIKGHPYITPIAKPENPENLVKYVQKILWASLICRVIC
jgi:hypothetical protein